MHELLLYGQVPSTRHEQVLKVLAGVAAMQPHRVLQRTIIYKPTKAPQEPGAHLSHRGGSQEVRSAKAKQPAAKDLYYTKLVQRLTEEDFGRGGPQSHEDGKRLSANVKPGEEPKWSFEFQDTPDTGDRGVSIRLTTSTDLISGDPHEYMVAAGPNR